MIATIIIHKQEMEIILGFWILIKNIIETLKNNIKENTAYKINLLKNTGCDDWEQIRYVMGVKDAEGNSKHLNKN